MDRRSHRDGSPVPASWTARWVVLRWASYHEVDTAGVRTQELDEALSRLPGLEKVVVETPDVECAVPIVECLPAVQDKIHVWSMDDAKEFTTEAKRRPESVPLRWPTSPCWLDEA